MGMVELQQTLGTKELFESQGLHPTKAVPFVLFSFGLVWFGFSSQLSSNFSVPEVAVSSCVFPLTEDPSMCRDVWEIDKQDTGEA